MPLQSKNRLTFQMRTSALGPDGAVLDPDEPALDQMEFLDIVVDGKPLRDTLHVRSEDDRPAQHTTFLREARPELAIPQIDRWLGRINGDFDDGRIALFVCPICSDLACGALTMELRATADTISWLHLGWQDGITDGPQPWLLPEQSLSFERTTYETELLALRDHFTSLIKPGWRPFSASDGRHTILDRIRNRFTKTH
ncbi:hypothetical protein [Arthrobacter sp. Z4-13]